MIDTAYCIENEYKRALFHPRKDGKVNVCFLDKVKDIHKHKIFENLTYAQAMGRSWCSITELKEIDLFFNKEVKN